MKQGPIMFSTEMVEAIINGEKTQTRRIVKPQPSIKKGVGKWIKNKSIQMIGEQSVVFDYMRTNSRYGQPGDVLWVKETWQLTDFLHPSDENYGYIYKASENGRDWEENEENWRWKSPFYMPKEACRLFLRIKDIRIERLHDITTDDIISEGVKRRGNEYCIYDFPYDIEGMAWTPNALMSYITLWEKINGKGSWIENPYVFVIDFKIQKILS